MIRKKGVQKGFIEFNNSQANGNTVHVKNGLKKIHNIRALMNKLELVDYEDLRKYGYDVDSYIAANGSDFGACDHCPNCNGEITWEETENHFCLYEPEYGNEPNFEIED